MATLKLTANLREQIKQKINTMRNHAERELPVMPQPQLQWDDPRVLTAVFGEGHVDAVRSLPCDFFARRDSLPLEVISAGRRVGTRVHSATVPNTNKRVDFVLPHSKQYPTVRVDGLNLHQWPELEGIFEISDARAEFAAHWQEMQNSVMAFFNSFPSINSAIKHTPAMSMYLPADAILKMEEKVERKKGPVEVGVDVDSLVATAAIHRLGGAA